MGTYWKCCFDGVVVEVEVAVVAVGGGGVGGFGDGGVDLSFG